MADGDDMYSALDIAKYIISKCNRENCPISNLQLQKILYNLQKAFLQSEIRITEKKSSALFGDEIEAWQWGPVVPSVYYVYCTYGSLSIIETYDVHIDARVQKFIDPIIERQRSVNPWRLVDETHRKGGAWDRVYRNGMGNRSVIPCELIRICG